MIPSSLTEKRGLQAQQHILEEVRYLCNIIKENGEQQHDGTVHIKFEKLFDIYTNISNKLVGILLRARKYGYVTFPGEILFQHKDDHVIIKLIHQS
ncbi:unnamed protein product [Didymodactylos carnosus]|uniref:Costars domain-containing protein n=1 Tax=Didymodactylos carnosus TaxID=1234261 RepID=A0A8S2FY21_9BILA|nr:unnamed protein product [Didymodactylos carnosus]CAF4389750.1 unnamed protein product [Didymodactylos carnosus]